MGIVTAILAFVIAVCILVAVHEFGHYWVARKLGFKVLRFSIGFGRPLWQRTGTDQTEYVLAAIPLGGYVRLLDEREGPVAAVDLPRAFTRRPHWQRIAVLLAGPAANFLFAALVLTAMFLVSGRTEIRPVVGSVQAEALMDRAGLRAGDEFLSVSGRPVASVDSLVLSLLDRLSGDDPVQLVVRGADGRQRELQIELRDDAERRRLSDPARMFDDLGFRFMAAPIPAKLGAIAGGGPADRAGLREGDEVQSINGEPMPDFLAIVRYINAHPGETVTLRVQRAGSSLALPVTLTDEMVEGRRIGRMHVAQPPAGEYPPELVRVVRLGPVAAVGAACTKVWDLTALQARLLWRMLFGQVSVKNISGPLTIAQLAGESASAGVSEFLGYLVFVSLALGFMNLLPIPILDGGQVVLQSVEWLKGSPLSERTQALGQQLGILLVALLLGLALFNDLTRQFG